MHFISEQLEQYIEFHSESEPELLKDLNRETHQKVLQPRMLSGHFQGRVLSMLSKLISPSTVLEIGTYTGYSALCLCEGLKHGGTLHTIDNNEELYDFQRRYFDKSQWKENIVQHLGNALEIIPGINETFDLVFIDADKENYPQYFNMVIPMMRKRGVILSDNVLWSGKVLEEASSKDKSTRILQQYNKMLREDPRVETVLLPIRDGLNICRVI